MPDNRSKREKLMAMAAKGTPHEAAIARRKLDAMTDDDIDRIVQHEVPTQAEMFTVFGRSAPFGEVRKTVRLSSQELTFTDPGPFDE